MLSAQETLAFEQAELQPHQSCAGVPQHPCAPTTDSLLKRPPDWLQQGLPASGAPTLRAATGISLETRLPTNIRASTPQEK